MTLERCSEILRAYVENDIEGSEIAYARGVLEDMCGCNETELRELGLDWLIYD